MELFDRRGLGTFLHFCASSDSSPCCKIFILASVGLAQTILSRSLSGNEQQLGRLLPWQTPMCELNLPGVNNRHWICMEIPDCRLFQALKGDSYA
jgi:hypothetical protein